MTKLIYCLALMMILSGGTVMGAGGYLTQAQLDSFDVDTLTPFEQPPSGLGCQILGEYPYFYIIEGYVQTFFSCYEVEKVEDDLYYYHNDSVHSTIIPLSDMEKVWEETGYDYNTTMEVYWQRASIQFFDHFDGFIYKIRSYQTPEDSFWDDWGFGGLW